MISDRTPRFFRLSPVMVLFVCGALSLIAPRASAQSYIFGRGDFATGAAPVSVVAADLNGDGRPDLAVANSGDKTVSIFLGKPDGTFQPHADYPVGGSPSAVATGDFNGDGKLDLAVANLSDNTVSILLGNGDGTFQGQTAYATGKSPGSVALGDFNGDQKLDLAVSNNGAATVSVLLGKGDGTLAAQTVYGTGSALTSLIAADFRGNGILDLVAAGAGALILLGNGDGTFQAAARISGDIGPESLAAADIDGDGKLDVAIADGGSSTVLTLLGNGDGTFSPANYKWGTGVTPVAVAIADLNADGKPDLVTANSSGFVSVLIQNSSITVLSFAKHVDYAVAGKLTSVALADFNGDGPIDVAATNSTGNLASVFIGNGNGSIQIQTNQNLGDARASSLIAGDFNGDGKADLIVPIVYIVSPITYLSNGDGTFATITATQTLLHGFGATGDFNGDGKLDLAMQVLGSGVIAVLPGNGDGTFGTGVTLGSTSATGPILAGDFNGDGKLDLIYYDSATLLVLGNGDGTFGPPATIDSSETPVLTADFNADGKLDLILQSSQGSLSLLLGNGNGTFGAPSTVSSTSGPTATGDFNGDGKLDLAIFETGGVTILPGNGDGTFQPGISTTTPGSLIGAGDFNGDGISDLAVINAPCCASTFDILYGNGDGTFRVDVVGYGPTNLDQNNPVVGTAVGDMNGDGIPDLAVLANQFGGLPAGQIVSVLISQPVIGIYPSPVVFPDTAVGSTSTLNVTLSNPAVGQLAISSIAVSSGFTETNNCPQTLSAAASCTVTLTFSPTTAGAVAGSLTITDSSLTSPQTIPVTATAGAEVTLSPASLTFGSQLLNTTSPAQTITLTNPGVVTVDITSITSNSGEFTETTTCGSTLAPGANCTISVTFTPSVAGTRTGSISITDDAAGSPQAVTLTGTGEAPAAVASFSPASLSFAAQQVGTTSPLNKVTLTNTGTGSLSITSVAISGDFTLTNGCTGSVAVGASCTISVAFAPKTAGALSGVVSVTDNAAGSPQSVPLTGTGTQPAVVLAPVHLSFAADLAGQSSIASAVTLTNAGAAPLAVSAISFSGADAGDFSQQNNCGSSVPAGATCTIDVTFKPAAGGARSATLTIADNAPASPQSVALTGTGSDFSLALASGSPSSATVTAGQSASYTLSAGSVGGLTGSVSLACSGAPSAATCSVTPGSASIGSGILARSVTVNVATTARSGAVPRLLNLPPFGRWVLLTLAGLVCLALAAIPLGAIRRRGSGSIEPIRSMRSTRAFVLALGLLLAGIAVAIPGCGGGGSTTTTSAGTPAGTYTITVTGTYTAGSVTLQHGVSLTLKVQ